MRHYYNALLAFCCAMNVMKNWGKDRPEAWNMRRKDLDDAFVTAHIRFLRYTASTSEIPVFSNATTWYLAENLAKANAGKG